MIEWTDLIVAGIGLAGVLVGSLITVFKDTWTSWRQRKREASYAAIRLIYILEEYADHCIDVVQDDGTKNGESGGRTSDGQEYHAPQTSTPSPPEFPGDIAWRSLDGPLMQRVLALPNMARSTDRYIALADEYASFPFFEEYFEARQEGYARIGEKALATADDLRAKYEITAEGRMGKNTEWNPRSFLRKTINQFDQSNLPDTSDVTAKKADT